MRANALEPAVPEGCGLAIDDAIWDHWRFSKNQDRLLEHQVVQGLFGEVVRLADAKGLLSKEHVSLDAMLIQARANQRSFRPKQGPNDQDPGGGVDTTPRRTGRDAHAKTIRTPAPRTRLPATTARATAPVIAEINAGDTSTSNISCRCAPISRVLRPRAYSDKTRSSKPGIRR